MLIGLAAMVIDATQRLRDLGISSGEVHDVASGFDLGRLADVLTSALSGVLGIASSLVFIIMLVLFLKPDGLFGVRAMSRV